MEVALLQALISGLAVGSAYALVSLGFSVTFTTTKTLNFSHGEFVSAGAFIGMSVLLLAIGKPLTATSFGGVQPDLSIQLLALLAALGHESSSLDQLVQRTGLDADQIGRAHV